MAGLTFYTIFNVLGEAKIEMAPEFVMKAELLAKLNTVEAVGGHLRDPNMVVIGLGVLTDIDEKQL